MAEPVFSTSWYRVAALRPKLRRHARIHRHSYRGEAWYVLQDLSSGRFHRFSPDTHSIVSRMDGSRSVDELWRDACERLGDAAPTQDELISLLAQLHAADVLQANVSPDTAEILARGEKQRRRTLVGRWLSPFAVQIPLLDPDTWLRRAEPWLRPWLGARGLLLWLALVAPAAVLAVIHSGELTEGILDRALAPGNLLLLWLLFPLIKAFHELGHAAIARGFGAEIHEMGVMLLVFTPVPYVDASSTSAFPSKGQRMAVGAGGMLAELVLAALAMFVWVSAQPGLVRVLAFNTLLIGGATTVLFNANPLLRFDGYYILADWLEMPNLRQRSNQYVGYLVERWLLRAPDAEPPRTAPRERGWLVGYALASFAYRVLVTFAIALWVMDLSLPVGLLMLAMSAVGWFVMPAYKGIRFLLESPRLARVRARAGARAAGAIAGLALFLTAVPFPLRTLTEGVVWIPDEAQVRAKVDGFIDEIAAAPGSRVSAGDVLLRCRDRALEAELEVARATLHELQGRYDQALAANVAQAQVVAEELGYARESLARVEERVAELVVRAGTSGTFVLPRAVDLPGRWAAKGETLGQVVDLEAIRVRAVIGQDDVELVRERQRGVEVRPAEALGEIHPARVQRVVPAASGRLPHDALGSEGGGPLAVDPRDDTGHTTLEHFFEVELELPSDAGIVNAGGRVHVRFDHGWEPLAQQLYRRLRQVFLARLNV